MNDWLGHGSHVAGIIAARTNNGVGIAGVAPKVRVMAVGVFAPPGYGTFADEIEAILYAVDEGAKVINLSLGSNAYSRGEQMAVEYAVRHGVVVAAAAGNDGRELYHWPAAHEAAIAVAATTATDGHAGFSNLGDFVDVAAPGVSVWSLRAGGGYLPLSGTSMATPHVAGLVGLILARNPTLAPAEVRAILENTATDLGAPGWDKAYGYGRVDALAALQATPPYSGTVEVPPPDWLRTAVWPPLCQEAGHERRFRGAFGGVLGGDGNGDAMTKQCGLHGQPVLVPDWRPWREWVGDRSYSPSLRISAPPRCTSLCASRMTIATSARTPPTPAAIISMPGCGRPMAHRCWS